MTFQNIFLLIFAPFIGSFLGLLLVRLPKGRDIIFGRSRCDSCGVQLAAQDMVPIVNWLLLNAEHSHWRSYHHTVVAIFFMGCDPAASFNTPCDNSIGRQRGDSHNAWQMIAKLSATTTFSGTVFRTICAFAEQTDAVHRKSKHLKEQMR